MGDNDIDWARKLFCASVPEAKNALPAYKPDFQKWATNRALGGVIKNNGKLKGQNRHLKFFDLKLKSFDKLQKGLNLLSETRKIKGIEVDALDCAFLGYDLMNMALDKDLNNVDKIDKAAYIISRTVGRVLGAQIGTVIGEAVGIFFCPGLGTSVGGFFGGIAGSIIGENNI